MRLAYFSPLSPARSGISSYSEELLPWLAEHAEIDLFVDDYLPSHPDVCKRFEVYSQLAYGANRWAYDGAIFHLGNNLHHEGIYRTCLDYPGIIVLHDFILHGLAGGMTLPRGDEAGYAREMAYCDGLEGGKRGWRIAIEQEAATGHSYPLNRRVLDISLGVIVHSDHVKRLVLREHPLARIAKVDMGVPLPSELPQAREQARQALGLTPDDLLFASFGFLTPDKRIEVVLGAFSRLLMHYPQARYMIIGEALADYGFSPIIRSLGLKERVTVTGYVPADTYQQLMHAADVAVNLRYPTAGETSASVLRLLSIGLPTVVSDVGWFAELPDDCCRKLVPNDKEEENLYRTLKDLAGDVEVRCELGERARKHVEQHHSLAGAAKAYSVFIQAVLNDLL